MAQRLTGSRIREKRLDLGLRQAAVAEAVGISPSYLNLIEHNRRRIGGKLLSDLARVLGVDAGLLTQGADGELLDQLRTAAAAFDIPIEVARAEELAARYPGWARLIAAQLHQLAALDAQVQRLTDRLAFDPHLADSLHDVISSVTSIRSTASILVGQEQLDPDWQRRFHENIDADSRRLATSSESLIAYLDTPQPQSAGLETPTEQFESYLMQSGYHLPQLTGDMVDIDAVVASSGLTGAALQLLYAFCTQSVSDYAALPRPAFEAACQELSYDPAALARRFEAPFSTVFRRLAALPSGAGHPPMGLAVCDASGTVRLLKPVPGFALPRTGGGCPIWPIFGAFARPGQPFQADVALPGKMTARFKCYAISDICAPSHFDALPILQSTMLVVPDPPEDQVVPLPVGISCRICPRSACAARRELAMQGVTL